MISCFCVESFYNCSLCSHIHTFYCPVLIIYLLFVLQHRNITEYGDMWGQTLYLRRVRVSDTGWYTCLVNNLFGASHASAWLQVISKTEARMRAQKSSAAILAKDSGSQEGLHRIIFICICLFLSLYSWHRFLGVQVVVLDFIPIIAKRRGPQSSPHQHSYHYINKYIVYGLISLFHEARA